MDEVCTVYIVGGCFICGEFEIRSDNPSRELFGRSVHYKCLQAMKKPWEPVENLMEKFHDQVIYKVQAKNKFYRTLYLWNVKDPNGMSKAIKEVLSEMTVNDTDARKNVTLKVEDEESIEAKAVEELHEILLERVGLLDEGYIAVRSYYQALRKFDTHSEGSKAKAKSLSKSLNLVVELEKCEEKLRINKTKLDRCVEKTPYADM